MRHNAVRACCFMYMPATKPIAKRIIATSLAIKTSTFYQEYRLPSSQHSLFAWQQEF